MNADRRRSDRSFFRVRVRPRSSAASSFFRFTGARTRAAAAALCALALAAVPPAAARDERPGAAPAAEYRVEVEVDLDGGRYAGRQTVRYTNRSKGAVKQLVFNLYPNVGVAEAERPLQVTAARDAGGPLETRVEGPTLRVELPGPLEPGRALELALEFEGRAVRREPKQVDLEEYVTDQVEVVLDPTEVRRRAGTDLLTVSGDAMLLGNPFPVLAVPKAEGRKPGPGEYAFAESSAYRIEVRAAEEVDVVASGVAAGGGAPGPRVFEGAALRNVAVFASRGYRTLRAEAGGVRLRSVHRPEHEAAARRALGALEGSVAFYAEAFGRAPFEEIAVVEAPLVPGISAVAFSGLIAAATAYYTDVRGAEGRTLPGFIRETPELMEGEIEFAVAREAARQWWGEAVGSDPRRSPVLTKGLASSSAVLATARMKGAEEGARAVEQRLRTPYRVFRMFGGADAPADRAPDEFPNYFSYAAIVETKAGLFVEALRRQLGDERFLEALRRYYEANAGGIVEPRDLTAALVDPADRKAASQLDQLYEHWIKQRNGDADIGEPQYAVAVSPGVTKAANAESPERRSGFDRFGRFVVRMFTSIGKTAAKPF